MTLFDINVFGHLQSFTMLLLIGIVVFYSYATAQLKLHSNAETHMFTDFFRVSHQHSRVFVCNLRVWYLYANLLASDSVC